MSTRTLEYYYTIISTYVRSRYASPKSNINEIPPGTMVDGDKNRLEQIFYNLIGNGVKFTEHGFVRLHALIQGERIQVLVEDTGIGIPMEQQQEIFKEFVQVDGSTERQYGGTGLGLCVVRQLIELHNGTVEIASELGKGSIFSFNLCMADAVLNTDCSDQAQAITISSTRAAAQYVDIELAVDQIVAKEEGQILSKNCDDIRNILIVDDEELNREVLKNYLELNCYKSLIAKDGREGLDVIHSNKPDLIMLDIMMPHMSGYDFCRKVREIYSETELPIIMVTAKTKEDDITLGFKVGANDYVTKPYNRDVLFARVGAHLTISKQYTAVKRADHAKSQFFKIMNHELRTPLNAMIGYTEMVCDDLSDAGMDAYVDDLNNALTAGRNLSTMINAVLDLNKITAGDDKIAIAEFNVQPLMEAINQLFVPLLAKNNNKLFIDIAQAQTHLIYTDYHKLLLILSNLVDNGCKFTHDGDIRISVDFVDNGTRFVIIDTGIGIRAEQLEKIFEPFMQADTSDIRKYGGTGIGLALVMANTNLLQGNIDVTSREGDGSKFTLFVPNLN